MIDRYKRYVAFSVDCGLGRVQGFGWGQDLEGGGWDLMEGNAIHHDAVFIVLGNRCMDHRHFARDRAHTHTQTHVVRRAGKSEQARQYAARKVESDLVSLP